MEYNEIAAKRRKKRKNSFIYAPFAHFCGNSLLPICSLCKRLFSKIKIISGEIAGGIGPVRENATH
jgi:hypothetical protein